MHNFSNVYLPTDESIITTYRCQMLRKDRAGVKPDSNLTFLEE
jgi:hypothetical protein